MNDPGVEIIVLTRQNGVEEDVSFLSGKVISKEVVVPIMSAERHRRERDRIFNEK